MIRIDEIYNNTFWPWLSQNRQQTRLFYCDPFGHTDCEHLFNLGPATVEDKNYVFFHDQEPVDMELFQPLFNDVLRRNKDIWLPAQPHSFGHVVVSERGDNVQKLCDAYGWTPHYYFFHGWACLDWYRGYNKTFLIARARDRKPTRTFFSPNRIIGGKRDHRTIFLYHIYKNNLQHNWISAPRHCPHENTDIITVASKYNNTYSDIEQVLSSADLPRTFPGEQTQNMSSCWLTNFEQCQDSVAYVATETLYFGNRLHITEKTFKAIALEMPFILVAPAGSLEYMREYGFRTFSPVLDEDYDQEPDDIKRMEMIVAQLKQLDSLSVKEKQQIHRACLPMVEHNYNHFYGGGFGQILWLELNSMLEGIHV
jgi:hypothetical protein